MTLRATFLGLLFAFFVSVVVYFNDHIIQQTYLIGCHFPIIIFGVLCIAVLLVNPFLAHIGFKRPLTPKEFALIAALGLAVCGWPGSGFFRGFTGIVAMPSNLFKVNASWKATHVMSYVPGASFLLGEGHVVDWQGLATRLIAASDESGPGAAKRVWELLPETARGVVTAAARRGRFEPSERSILLDAINHMLSDPHFAAGDAFAGIEMGSKLRGELNAASRAGASDRQVQRANRALLVAAFPGIVAPAPPGNGILLADGDIQSPAVQDLLQGKQVAGRVALWNLHWKTWLPTLIVWGTLAILFGVASVCLVVVFQPQWKRELLPYPIARFVNELTLPAAPGGPPAVLRNKLFWWGFAVMVAIHLVNGLHAWFPNFIQIPLKFDFGPMLQLFPRARQFWWGGIMLWGPTLLPTVTAFAFFLSTEVSFSVGISGILYITMFSVLVGSGVTLDRDWLNSGNENLLRFGSYLGIAVVLFFVGRRYYTNVIASSFGLRRNAETPSSAVWAARLFYLCIALATILLTRYGVDWFFGVQLVLITMLLFAVMARVNVETGCFFMQPFWMPVGVVLALYGIEAVGPTGYLVMAMTCMIIAGDPRECVMPFVANALHMVTAPLEKKPPGRLALLVGAVVVGGFIVTLCSTLYFQYNHGINHWDSWATHAMPDMPFSRLSARISELGAYGGLSQSTGAGPWERLSLIKPDARLILWIAMGFALVIACSLLRLRFSWWPLHPVAFLVWGTFPGAWITMSFLLGWIAKAAVMKMSGAKGYRVVKPFMVGIIAGELFAAIGWSVFGTVYYFTTNLVPHSYKVFPW